MKPNGLLKSLSKLTENASAEYALGVERLAEAVSNNASRWRRNEILTELRCRALLVSKLLNTIDVAESLSERGYE